jgi:hypothetical protein
MIHVARVLQLAGLVIVPTGLWIGLGHDDVRTELALLGVGGFLFLAGTLLQRKR